MTLLPKVAILISFLFLCASFSLMLAQVFVWLGGKPDQEPMQIKTSTLYVSGQVKFNTDQFLDLVQPVLAHRR